MGNTIKLSADFKLLKHYLTIKIAMKNPIFSHAAQFYLNLERKVDLLM